MDGPNHTSDPFGDPKFFKVCAYSTAVALAVMLGFTASIKDLFDDPTFVFSYKTVLFFILGWAAGYGFWAFIRKKVEQSR